MNAEFQTYLTVQERLQQALSTPCCSAEFSLVAAHGIKAVYGALSLLVQTAQDVVHVVGEEAFRIENGRDHSRNRVQGHRAAVRMSVPLKTLLDSVDEGIGIGGEAVGR